jgi:hypothetical protein
MRFVGPCYCPLLLDFDVEFYTDMSNLPEVLSTLPGFNVHQFDEEAEGEVTAGDDASDDGTSRGAYFRFVSGVCICGHVLCLVDGDNAHDIIKAQFVSGTLQMQRVCVRFVR